MISDDLIYLRKLESTDLEQAWEWINNSEISRKIGVKIPISKSCQQRWFERTDSENDKIVFAICLRDDDSYVGNISLDMIDLRHRNARFSIFIGNPSLRGQGIGSHAIRLLAEYAFCFLNLHRIWCKTTAGDKKVEKFYENLGFRKEGTLRQHEYIDGTYVDKTIYGLLKAETE